jgi:DNA/RNA endonuclease G (NUC1)
VKRTFLLYKLLCFSLLLHAQHTIEIKHTYYTMQFDTLLSTELLGCYIQTTAHAAAQPKIPRTGRFARFTTDPLLEGKVIANDKQYKTWNKAHPDRKRDRGHINPFSAFNFAADAALESMYYSNTTPQASYFNRHQWQAIEQYVMNLSRGNKDNPPVDSIKVWTGVLINPSQPKKMNAVFEPDYYWKVIAYKKDGQYTTKAWLGLNDSRNTDTRPEAIAVSTAYVRERVCKYYPDLPLDF